MSEKPLVTVIIATYNSEKVLPKALEALKEQVYPSDHMEILVIDGMSTDKTREIATSYGCIIFDNPKVEQGTAKIIGMKNAKGKYVLFVDSDEALESRDYVSNAVEALEDNRDCHWCVCQGYKRPEDYPALSGYISDFGDPFSFFVYNFPKDYRFYESVLRKNYSVIRDEKTYTVYKCDLERKMPLLEGGCGGAIFDLEYYDKYFPEVRTDIAALYHCFYLMYERGDVNFIYVKNSPLLHYSSDRFANYFKKLRWRVCNNIHFTEKSKEVFEGRSNFQKKGKFKKYLFIPYGISLLIPFLHSIYYAVSRKNAVYLMHCVFSFYVVFEIVFQYFLKLINKPPKLVAYGTSTKIDDK